MNKEKTPDRTPGPPPIGGAFISLDDAAERTRKFREDYVQQAYDKEEKIKANYFSKEQIQKLLHQPGCEGIRVYNAVRDKVDKDETGNSIDRREIIIVATDQNGDDLLEPQGGGGCSPLRVFMTLPASGPGALILGNPAPCPDMCGKPNKLNGG